MIPRLRLPRLLNFIYELFAFVLVDGSGANMVRAGLFGRNWHAVLMLATGLACAASIGLRARTMRRETRVASAFFFGLAAGVYTFSLSSFPETAAGTLGMLLLYGAVGGGLAVWISEYSVHLWKRRHPEAAWSPGERELIKRFAERLGEVNGITVEVDRWPDEEEHRLVDIRAVAGPFAIELAHIPFAISGERLAKRLRRVLTEKALKLQPYKVYGKSTLVLLEPGEMVPVKRDVLVSALVLAFDGFLPEGVDSIWCAEAGEDGEVGFFELTGELK